MNLIAPRHRACQSVTPHSDSVTVSDTAANVDGAGITVSYIARKRRRLPGSFMERLAGIPGIPGNVTLCGG